MSTKPVFAKAMTIRALTKARKTVWLMFEDGKFTHTVRHENVDNHTLVGTYSWRSPAASAAQISDDMHYTLEEWRARKMKITGRMHDAVREYRKEHGKWPTMVSIGHAELKELIDHFGYAPATIIFDYRFAQVSVAFRLADTDTGLSCSSNG